MIIDSHMSLRFTNRYNDWPKSEVASWETKSCAKKKHRREFMARFSSIKYLDYIIFIVIRQQGN